jgi:hypothetical protein
MSMLSMLSENHSDLKNSDICDDERDLLELFRKAIKSKYNVILVSSGEELKRS